MTRRQQLSDLSGPRASHSLFQIANTFLPFAAWMWLMGKTAHLSWLLTWVMAVPAALFVMRIFILQHDCGHGSFLRSRWASDWLGRLCGVLTLTPYDYWRHTHALHHKNFGKLEHREDIGYFTTLTVAEYEALTPRARWLYRLYRNPLVFCGFGGIFQFMVKHRFPWDTPRERRKEWASVAFTNAGLVALLWGLSLAWGWETVARVWLPTWLLVGWGGVWLFYVQHVFPDGYFAPAERWELPRAALEGSSYFQLPRVLAWFTGDIGLHHVHHYHPLLPNYRLRAAMAAIPELQQVKPLTLWESVGCWRLKLWDEERGCFVGLPERAPALRAAPRPSHAASPSASPSTST